MMKTNKFLKIYARSPKNYCSIAQNKDLKQKLFYKIISTNILMNKVELILEILIDLKFI
jgi:hypothetical protein